MLPILSLVTSVKDYLEVVHKVIEYDTVSFSSYTELGPIITYVALNIKNFLGAFISMSWLKNVSQSIPIVVPDISAAMISEVSVLDGYLHNAFTFLETPYIEKNGLFSVVEKFTIGFLNSFFLFLPTSTAHIITLRRFVVQGLSAGYIAGLGTIAGNVFWYASVLLGWRFFVIPWLSLDVFRYVLGFVLLVKYMWDSYNSQKTGNAVLEDVEKRKIFLLSFLLALTEQTSIYPFISNLNINPEASLLESFQADNYMGFILIHISYLLGLGLGSFCLLQFCCWFWENPAFKIYMWVISSYKVSTSAYYKVINFVFLYLTMITAINSIPYYGLDYTITNPLGYVSDDRLIQDKVVLETSFLGSKASDRNTRRNRGRHGRRERWKRRIRKYRTFDASLYDKGIYDLFTIEDLNYGFDRFWLRRKLRNHRVRFRFFPGPWMRNFKKQLAKPRLESYTGPRIEFFRILFEQVYHPAFHSPIVQNQNDKNKTINTISSDSSRKISILNDNSLYQNPNLKTLKNKEEKGKEIKKNYMNENSMLRKFVRKLDYRLKTKKLALSLNKEDLVNKTNKKVYSKRWKEIFSKISRKNKNPRALNFYNSTLKYKQNNVNIGVLDSLDSKQNPYNPNTSLFVDKQTNPFYSVKKESALIGNNISHKDYQILRYRSTLTGGRQGILDDGTSNTKNNTLTKNTPSILSQEGQNNQSFMLLHPLKFYLQQDYAFQRQLRYYTPNVFRKFSVENNAPYFRVMMRRYFYNYKPTNRWERTMRVASMRKARRKTKRIPRKLLFTGSETVVLNNNNKNEQRIEPSSSASSMELSLGLQNENRREDLLMNRITKPTASYSVVSKKASRYRYQIYKDVMQHWYYSPFNRFLMKLDVDSFIRRQPNSHFLTNKEEKLLHLRRFLLSEHYNTLRWYTQMEHYRSMKTKIGGSKSFSSRVYNQQFTGTFKKIRHLFNITPNYETMSSNNQNGMKEIGLFTVTGLDNNPEGNKTLTKKDRKNESLSPPDVLKFDQALYNEYPNKQDRPLLKMLVIHEELVGNKQNEGSSPSTPSSSTSSTSTNGYPVGTTFQNEMNMDNNYNYNDLLSNSQLIVRDYLIKAKTERNNYIKELLNKNDYASLTQFIYSGMKTRGSSPSTNQRSLMNQEKDYLLTVDEKNNIENQILEKRKKFKENILYPNLMEDLYTNFLKNWKRRVNNSESLKNYLNYRIDKREKQIRNKQKNLQKKFNNLKIWIENMNVEPSSNISTSSQSNTGALSVSVNPILKTTVEGTDNRMNNLGTSGLQKAIADGIQIVTTPSISLKDKKEMNLQNKNKEKTRLNDLVGNNAPIKNQYTTSLRISVNKLNDILNKRENVFTNRTDGSYLVLLDSLKNNMVMSQRKLKTTVSKMTRSGLKPLFFLFKSVKNKSLYSWRKKQRAIGKQKRLRKEFKLIFKEKQKSQSPYTLFQTKKRKEDSMERRELGLGKDNLSNTLISRKKRVEMDRDLPSLSTSTVSSFNFNNDNVGLSGKDQKPSFISSLIGFKRERSPQRRYRVRRNRGVYKKRTLAEKMKKEIQSLWNKNERGSMDRYNNIRLYNTGKQYNEENNNSSLMFTENILKKRNNKKRTHRSWKEKRKKYNRKRRKYLKRRRYAISKIRVNCKKYKRVKNILFVQNWWWKQYLPSIQSSTEALWQIEKDRLFQQKLAEFSPNEILSRESGVRNGMNENSILQIGNKDFKPLSLPSATRSILNLEKENNTGLQNRPSFGLKQTDDITSSSVSGSVNSMETNNDQNFQNINKLYENLFTNNTPSMNNSYNVNFLNTTLPFYAGWDESLRKFVVTNRMLSRQDAGFVNFTQNDNQNSFTNTTNPELYNKVEFTDAPLRGMNAATTLYWQIPFTTYDPDQFFLLGLDGFSPLSWRKFLFRHSILKSWLNSSALTNEQSLSRESLEQRKETNNGSLSLQPSSFIFINKKKERNGLLNGEYDNIFNTTNLTKKERNLSVSWQQSRVLKKRLLRVKKHPRTPVWFPSGPLNTQVLPVHYIYVFYKRARLPRNRYLGRRLLNVKNINNSETLNILKKYNPNVFKEDFSLTLRKRLKPKRKYHLKHDSSIVIPRRLMFYGTTPSYNISSSSSTSTLTKETETPLRWRPLVSKKMNKPISSFINEQKILRYQRMQRLNSSLSQTDQPSLRVKQLKRRVQRQILRSVWRYRPRSGGFVWPGDYLKFELVKAPRLKTSETTNSSISSTLKGDESKTRISSTSKRKNKRKKKRTLVEWQIQPKKYLYEKHNIKVLKKKYEKAFRSF